jgi:dihydroxyacetone kinase DhaKLM complex PTS-EIIA-like component DhaM
VNETETCQSITRSRIARGVMGKGTQSTLLGPAVCGRPVVEGSYACARHLAADVKIATALAAKRAAAQ